MSAGGWHLVVAVGVLAAGAALTEVTIRLLGWWEACTRRPGDRAVRELRAELGDPVEFAARWLTGPAVWSSDRVSNPTPPE